jgi:hypothetical protein
MAALAATTAIAPQAEPSPAPVETAPPSIGSTKALVPACNALRAVAVPAYFTSRTADLEFRDVATNLVKYVKSLDDGSSRDPESTSAASLTRRAMYLHEMDKTVAAMDTNIDALRKALNDPRLPKDSTDPRIIEQRKQLQQLLDVQLGREQIIENFINGELATIDSVEASQISDSSSLGGLSKPKQSLVHPDPNASPPPTFTGVAVADDKKLKDWIGGVMGVVVAHEDQVVKSFISISNDCKK